MDGCIKLCPILRTEENTDIDCVHIMMATFILERRHCLDSSVSDCFLTPSAKGQCMDNAVQLMKFCSSCQECHILNMQRHISKIGVMKALRRAADVSRASYSNVSKRL